MSRTIVHAGELDVHDERIVYTLYRVPRRRHVHLVIGNDGELEVRAPYRFSREGAEAVIRSHAAWVRRSLRSAQELYNRRPTLETGTELPLLDERLVLVVSSGRCSSISRQNNLLEVESTRLTPEDLRLILERWYRNEAHAYLPRRLFQLAENLKAYPSKVAIRAQKTRWGSCSARGTISLNWRLMLLPSELTDYVLVHELAHLRYMDHSARFWAFVARAIPDFQERRTRLRAVQLTLVL